MEIPKTYNPKDIEAKWYNYWLEQSFFTSKPDERESYTIVIPPPNVTGVLHMGHMLNNTIQDVLIRKARLQGKNACWVPGTDHASIATEAKVVAKLKAEGINKWDISREEFLEHAWEWTHKHGGIILDQLKRLGASCDWDRTSFTMDEARYESVIKVFVDLYNKGKIYRGFRMVNWDPEAKTTVSDEEVIHKDVNQKLYYLKYKVVDSDEYVTIATTRPETILGDTAVCINPNDERFTHLKGKKVIVPIANREIPIIEDDYVDMEFGTGCLKITPAHDVNDKEIGDRHNLEIIDILNEDGTLNQHGLHFAGQDRFAVRKNISAELEEMGVLVKTEEYQTSVGTSERTGSVIEPRLSEQWFLSMKEISEPALKAVMDNVVQLIPGKFKNTYRHWMENVRDWNISRQLYWGHQIPAWYFGEGKEDFVVAENENAALELAKEKTGKTNLTLEDLKQDPDVLDTWFSSWLWPISVFDGIRNPGNEEVKYYYPTQTLVTAPEILFFWVARMIIAGYEYENEKPFSDVYLTGIVRDKQGRKMSKSLGNSPDPIELMEQYGADGVRVGMLLCSPAGNDLPFDESLCEQGRNFSNKIWNTLRLIKGFEIDESIETPQTSEIAMQWFEERLAEVLVQLEAQFEKFKLSEALMTLYKLIWDDFCSWYLEMIKPDYQKPIDRKTYEQSIVFFEQLMQLIHPFMPFVSEEIWHLLKEDRAEEDCITVSSWPEVKAKNPSILEEAEIAKQVISKVREIRNKNGLKKRELLDVFAQVESADAYANFKLLIERLAFINPIEWVDEEKSGLQAFVLKSDKFYVDSGQEIETEAEREKIESEIKYTQGFLKSVKGKLSNERFVNNAPEAVVAKEKQKMADGEAKLKALEEQLAQL